MGIDGLIGKVLADRDLRRSLKAEIAAVQTANWRKRLHAARALFAQARRLGVAFGAYETGLEDWLTPIEAALWQDIRQSGLPMIAGVPVGRYWLDFGDIDRRIGIEADGRGYHDTERDTRRDEALAEIGWTVFRVTGQECKRALPCRAELRLSGCEDDEIERRERDFYMTTSEGVCRAIAAVYYNHDHEHPAERWMVETLASHNLQGWSFVGSGDWI